MNKIFLLLLSFSLSLILTAKPTVATSPDGKIKIEYNQGTITISDGNNVYIKDAQIGITATQNGKTYSLGNGFNIELRAFNNGVAYRFISKIKGDYIINSEQADFTFTRDFTSYLPHSTNPKKPEAMAFQATFDVAPISQQGSTLVFLPGTIDCGTAKLTILESDLNSYPGMFLSAEGTTLKGWFPKYPKNMAYYNYRHMTYVKDTEDYIARCSGPRTFPWRIIAIAHNDTEMPTSDLVARLAEPSRLSDTSWIKHGRVAWDWWNDWGLTNVPFKAGINTETYKYYIDFASRYGLEYIILDEGWYNPTTGDIMNTIPEINLPELIAYGKQKKVGIILWCVFNVLDEHLKEACEKYSAMGIKGFKVDFMDRNDQTAVEMTYRIAEECAKNHLILDYHGIYSPAGLNITYPNVINFEAVFGMEEVKWTQRTSDNSAPSKDMPLYDVTFPYIRLQAGPVDFTPGGMRNATKADFQPIYSNPMTMGTRCHQMANYIIHNSNLTMFADNPTSYEQEPEFTRLLASIPSATFTDMKVLSGKMGEYIVVLRTDADGNYFIGGQTNWDSRDIVVDCSAFIQEGQSIQATIIKDGVNAEKTATDWQQQSQTLTNSTRIPLHLASGGGFVIIAKK